MPMKRSATIAVLLLCSIVFFQAAPLPQQEECKEQLRTILQKMSGRDHPGTISFEYQVRSKSRQKGTPESVTRVKMRAGKDRTEIISSQMEFYQDKIHAFTVLPSRKIIYWGDSQLSAKDTSRANDLHELQRRVFTHSTLKSCTVIENNSHCDKQAVLIPDAELIKRFGFRDITYFINTKTGSLYKALINYAAGPLEFVEMTYLDISYQEHAVGSDPVQSKILTPQGKLQARYSGYELIDMRAKRNRQ